MNEKNKRVCPVENAKSLDNIFRKLVQNPKKILKDYVKEGMTVLDVGCGPGFFSVEMADMVGESGNVIAADLQQGMLEKVEKKIKGSYIENRIELHKCEKDRIGITTKVDHILAVYMVHEVPDMDKFLAEMYSILKPDGSFLIIEPPFHVSKKAFEETVNRACARGFKEIKRPGMILNKAVVLGK
ncbi:MAG: methyltransferase domain-containing protein [Methanosarcinales archaeon]|nr:methyltransferase domain-containing protein [Methanosarcinales archaeon]